MLHRLLAKGAGAVTYRLLTSTRDLDTMQSRTVSRNTKVQGARILYKVLNTYALLSESLQDLFFFTIKTKRLSRFKNQQTTPILIVVFP